ncbi:alpha/beta hydrolase [Nocardia stercoris]|uniref:Serine aminopeptidase S33 domain-containing protein n=1 Tax=Nocardia stercoris TaxID=2483361 RepID=A0A3M2L6B9_9NOCA|nr:hypothetical protein [Nocardia stercoris]RMI33262.1 hypothetical protein EBN03_08745 [Nocardia stercoris]
MGTTTDPAAVATEVVELLRAERFDELTRRFAPPLREAAAAPVVAAAWRAELARVGAITGVVAPRTEPIGGGQVRAIVDLDAQRGGLAVRMAVDAAGTLHGFRLAAPESGWVAPEYVHPKRFTEHAVTVGSGELAVGGTVSVPRGRGPHPAVVLLASGPADRDATVGPNKPFKDLAWGLASRGVAVLRFDKVTFTHPRIADDPAFTMAEEFIPHGLAALEILRRTPGIDSQRLYLLGHSAGSAPRVAIAAPAAAGVILLSVATAPLPRSAVRVARHLATTEPQFATPALVDTIIRQAAVVESPGLETATAADLLFGWSPAYWRDRLDYDAVAATAALHCPALVLQGERDYQVTVADDFPAWRTGLAGRPHTTLRTYPGVDHMYFSGSGPSTAAGYQVPAHFAGEVAADIADWIRPDRPRTALRRLLDRLSPARV